MTFGISNSKSIWFVIWLALLTVPLEAEVIFQETFPGGERDKLSPPASLAWYATVPDPVKIEQGAMVLSGANASQHTGNKAVYTGSGFFERLPSSKGIKITSYQNHKSVGLTGTRPGSYEAGTPYSVEFTMEGRHEQHHRISGI